MTNMPWKTIYFNGVKVTGSLTLMILPAAGAWAYVDRENSPGFDDVWATFVAACVGTVIWPWAIPGGFVGGLLGKHYANKRDRQGDDHRQQSTI